MNTLPPETATIYKLAPRPRVTAGRPTAAGTATVTALPVKRPVEIMPESGWYHDVEIRKEDTARR